MPKREDNIFRPIVSEKNGTTAQEVVARLREMIHRGELLPGDRLPPERDLAKLLGVSRPTLRAGIRSLSTIGILQSRQGAGTFVAEAQTTPTLDGSALKLLSSLHGFTDDEMFEARIVLEMSVAGLAAERATGEQVTQLAEELAGLYATTDDHEKYLIHDAQFHQVIAAASQNRILTIMMNMVTTILCERRSSIKQPKDLRESAERHHLIFKAIREGNSENAKLAMLEHLTITQKLQRSESDEDFSVDESKGS